MRSPLCVRMCAALRMRCAGQSSRRAASMACRPAKRGVLWGPSSSLGEPSSTAGLSPYPLPVQHHLLPYKWGSSPMGPTGASSQVPSPLFFGLVGLYRSAPVLCSKAVCLTLCPASLSFPCTPDLCTQRANFAPDFKSGWRRGIRKAGLSTAG